MNTAVWLTVSLSSTGLMLMWAWIVHQTDRLNNEHANRVKSLRADIRAINCEKADLLIDNGELRRQNDRLTRECAALTVALNETVAAIREERREQRVLKGKSV